MNFQKVYTYKLSILTEWIKRNLISSKLYTLFQKMYYINQSKPKKLYIYKPEKGGTNIINKTSVEEGEGQSKLRKWGTNYGNSLSTRHRFDLV